MEPTRFPELTRRFVFNGKASALGGQIYLPDKTIVDLACGSSALGVSGGISRSSTEGQKFGDVLSFGFAETRSEGLYTNDRLAQQVVSHRRRQDELPTATMVTARIKELQASRQPLFTAGEISAQLISRMPNGKGGETRFQLTDETAIRGVVVTDESGKQYPLEVTLNPAFQKRYDTRTRLLAAGDDVLPRTYVRGETPRGGKVRGATMVSRPPRGSRPKPPKGGPIYATIVKDIRWTEEPYPGSEINANIVQIPNLGLVFFGELLAWADQRRLTMVRFEFGSFCAGYADGVDVMSNGSFFP